MAEPADRGTEQETGPAPQRGGGLKPDMATLAGIVLALGGIVGGLILEKGSIQDILQGTAALIVLGGTFGAVLVTTPMTVLRGAVKALRDVFFERALSFHGVADEIILFASKARKHGIVSLEADAEEIADPYLKKALGLAVDGTDLQELRHMMELEIAISEQRLEGEARVWESAGGYAPTVGIIGAVLGLIQVMKRLDDIKEVGHGIAVAFVATVYGVGLANLLLLPAASKLRARAARNTLMQEMMLAGVVGIMEGLNPKLIRIKLEAFTGPPPKSAPAPEPARAPSKGDTVAA